MLRKNPYYIQDNIRLDLRDSKGRYTSASRAKKYYLYVDEKLVTVGEFPRVGISIDRKEEIITDAVNRIYAEGWDRAEDFEIPVEEKFEESVREKTEEKFVDEDLAEVLYEDLLDLLYEEFPLDFEEITGKKVKANGRTRKREKLFETFTIGGMREARPAENDIYTFKLAEPIDLSTTDPNDLIEIVEKYLLSNMKRIFDRKTEGENFFIVSIHFSLIDAVTKQEREQGLSMSRFEADTWDQFLNFIRDMDFGLFGQIMTYYVGYLKNTLDNTLTTLGFKIEHLHTIQ